MEKEIITEMAEKIIVTYKPKIDIMMVTYFHEENQGYDSGEEDDDYPIIWFITEKGRINSAEILDWKDWAIHHIQEISHVISQRTGWAEHPILTMLTSTSEKGKNIRPFWEG